MYPFIENKSYCSRQINKYWMPFIYSFLFLFSVLLFVAGCPLWKQWISYTRLLWLISPQFNRNELMNIYVLGFYRRFALSFLVFYTVRCFFLSFVYMKSKENGEEKKIRFEGDKSNQSISTLSNIPFGPCFIRFVAQTRIISLRCCLFFIWTDQNE